jgi:hypothetical protein
MTLDSAAVLRSCMAAAMLERAAASCSRTSRADSTRSSQWRMRQRPAASCSVCNDACTAAAAADRHMKDFCTYEVKCQPYSFKSS